MLGSVVLHALLLAALVPLHTPLAAHAPVRTTAQLTPSVDLETPPPAPDPELEVPEPPPADVEPVAAAEPRDADEELAEAWHEEEESELRDQIRDTIFCPDPRSAGARFRAPRRSAGPAAEQPPAAPQEAARPPVETVRRPPEAAPPPRPTPAAILAHVAPAYPRTAREHGIEGVVSLRVVVEANGEVGDITVVRSSGSALLDRAAESAVREWEFRPATVRGQPVRSTLDLPPIRFRLTD